MKNIFIRISILFLLIMGCKGPNSEESKIQKIADTFIRGRLELRKNDTLTLKSVSDEQLYRLIMLNEQHAKVLLTGGATGMRQELYFTAGPVEIKGNTATCTMLGMEDYRLNLQKTGDTWKVIGENEIYATPEKIASVQQKIKEQKELMKNRPAIDIVLKLVVAFFEDTKTYFDNHDPKVLRKHCDKASADFIERLYHYAEKKNGLKLIKEEMEKNIMCIGDVFFEGDKATYKFYNEDVTILLRKTKDSYIITGFNNLNAKSISEQDMSLRYADFLRALKWVREVQYRNKAIR